MSHQLTRISNDGLHDMDDDYDVSWQENSESPSTCDPNEVLEEIEVTPKENRLVPATNEHNSKFDKRIVAPKPSAGPVLVHSTTHRSDDSTDLSQSDEDEDQNLNQSATMSVSHRSAIEVSYM
ncbi:hypothetical protein Ciccas_002930 [Cichlidogyrus casuarinus]|uniref:Uncharacterized protein n=1 Tax=Cichlidogyrus casuarinus TaxID=1844966 RepID=A0ABD2QFU6_9PLAT